MAKVYSRFLPGQMDPIVFPFVAVGVIPYATHHFGLWPGVRRPAFEGVEDMRLVLKPRRSAAAKSIRDKASRSLFLFRSGALCLINCSMAGTALELAAP